MVAANSSQPYSLLFLLTGHLKNFLILGQNWSTGVISRDGVGLEQDSSRIQEEKKRINPKETPDRSEDYNDVIEQQQDITRPKSFPSKGIRINFRKVKWNQKYDNYLSKPVSEYEEDLEIEALLDSESETETELDPEPRKVKWTFEP